MAGSQIAAGFGQGSMPAASPLAAGLRTSIRTVEQLSAYLAGRGIDPVKAGVGQVAEPVVLPLRIPRYYLDLIDWNDREDPLRLQVIPRADETTILPDDLTDPIGDEDHSPVPGIVHRYPDRVLFLVTATCAVHCRFCFRREFIGKPARTLRRDHVDGALAYIAAHPEIWEVILSGGDPLVFPDPYLAVIFRSLRAIPHVRIIRVHTRTPTIMPQRLTPALAALARAHSPVYFVVHVNHPREVTETFSRHVGYLVDAGVPVLSQSVLLRGVNDRVDTLSELFRRLVEARVKPYYLHQLDRAPGTNHFRVPLDEGIELMRSLRGHISGLCLPTYVLDIPGGHGKVPIGPAYVHRRERHHYSVLNHRGETFSYDEPAATD